VTVNQDGSFIALFFFVTVFYLNSCFIASKADIYVANFFDS